MNKNLIFGIGGLLIGAVGGGLCGWFGCKKKYEQQAAEEIALMREHYEEKERTVKKVLNAQYGVEQIKKKLNEEGYADTDINFAGSKETLEKMRDESKSKYQYVDEKRGIMVTYEDPAESEHPEDDEEEAEDPDDIGEVNREYEKNKHKNPKIISVEEAGNLPPGTENECLFLYTYDDTITDENDEEIEQPELLLGDCLEKYDFYDSDEKIMFVMNYEMSTCYEISKIDAAWGGR